MSSVSPYLKECRFLYIYFSISLDAEDIRNKKVKVLGSTRPLQLKNVVTGQYKSHTKDGITYPGYADDTTVPNNSITPTFVAAALFIDNARWDGVPFPMKAGKALNTRRCTDGWIDMEVVEDSVYESVCVCK